MIGKIGNNFNFFLDDSSKNLKNQNKLSFSSILTENLNQVNQLQKKSDKLAGDFVIGKTDNIHQVTIATEKAKTALNLTSAIHNKVIESYEEIMRMQV